MHTEIAASFLTIFFFFESDMMRKWIKWLKKKGGKVITSKKNKARYITVKLGSA